jgi:MFS family permease
LTTLLYAGLALIWLPHGLRTVRGRVTTSRVIWESWREVLADVAHNPRFLQFLAAMLFMAIAFVQVGHVLAVGAVDRGLTPAAYGIVMGFNGLLIVLFELPLNQWARRFQTNHVLIAGYTLTGLGCAAFAWADAVPDFLWAMALFTLGEMLAIPSGSSYSGELAPEKYRGRYFGLSGTIWALAGLLGSSGMWFYGRLGANWWLVAGGCALLGALIMIPRLREPAIVAIPAK